MTKASLSLRTILAAAILALAACSDDGGDSDDSGSGASADVSFDAQPVIENVVDNVIVATYVDLDDQAEALRAAVEALNTGGATEEELDAAQARWKATRVPWESSEGFLFGPVDALGIDPAIDSWPLSRQDLDAFLSDGQTDPDDVRNAADNVQGFHALEYLLFGEGETTNDQPVGALDADELDYLNSLAVVLDERTTTLESGWTTQYDPNDASTGPYVDEVKSPGTGSVYASQGAVIEELINGLVTIVDEVGNGKIGEPFGTSAAGADTTLVESQYSWNSLTDFYNNVQSVLNVYTGKRGYDPDSDSISTGMNGVYTFVAAHDSALADRVLDEIIDAHEKIGLIDTDGDPDTTDIQDPDQIPFRDAIQNSGTRAPVQDAIDALATLQATLENDVLPLVGATDFGG